MTVSVIVPVYNTERYVAEAIDSILAQTLPADEIIVVDDGSTDRTSEVLRGFKDKITHLSQPQSGCATACNTGLARSSGTLISFLDADDLWHPDKLRQQCDLLEREPDVEAVFCGVRQFISPDAVEECKTIAIPQRDQAGVFKSAMLIRRPAFERIGAFDSSLRQIDFVEWYGRAVIGQLRTHILPAVLTQRRIHASNSGRRDHEGQRSEDLLALKRMLDLRRQGRTPPTQ